METLRDTGVGDTLEHATTVLTREFAFEWVLEHHIDNGIVGLCILRLFLHDGVLAQIESGLTRDQWLVSDVRVWGCADVHDGLLFDTVGISSSHPISGDLTLPTEERRRVLQIGRSAGSFGLDGLLQSDSVTWIAP